MIDIAEHSARRFDMRKCPFPWFGGKSQAAPLVWELLSDVAHYVEPFAGSLAVLLNRPHEANRTYYSETVNDLDGCVVNAWRAIQAAPEGVAKHASNPVAECDLHARHCAIVRWRYGGAMEHLAGDPDYFDARIAGWWLWGVSSWIGSGFASGKGVWSPNEHGRLRKGGRGVKRKLPHLSNNGQGVNHAQMREPGVAYHNVVMPLLVEWMQFLSARLRHVRILNGDWTRSVTTGATLTLPVRQGKSPCGVFLDPPYADTAGRAEVYTEDSFSVAHDVREWALKTGDDKRYRIVVAGFDGEHGDAFRAAGWDEHEWFASGFLKGGMALQGADGHQQHRERLWSSPHCLRVDDGQGELFG